MALVDFGLGATSRSRTELVLCQVPQPPLPTMAAPEQMECNERGLLQRVCDLNVALARLARAASTLYDGTEPKIPHLDIWFRTEFDLKVALQDDTIEKNAKLRDFEFEGKTYDRTLTSRCATTPRRPKWAGSTLGSMLTTDGLSSTTSE